MNRHAGLALVGVRPRSGRYERRTDAGPDLVGLHSPDGRFLEASPAAAPLLGRRPDDLLGLRWEDLVDRSDRQRVSAWWRSLTTSSSDSLTFRATRARQVVWLDCVASVTISNGAVSHIHTVTRDVTHHRSHAEELSRRCRDLERQMSHLEQANRDLLVLAADAAHDLRAPVQVITGFGELLAAREGARLDVVSQEFLAHILAAAGNMADLVEAVLEHSRATSAALDPVPVDCNSLVADVVMRLRPELDDRSATVEVDELPVVHADRVQLGRVFQNLLANALKAVPSDRQPHISVGARRVPWQWQLTVTDNGVGVAAEDRIRIFEPFQRGQHGGTGGTGLGLAICKAVAERHGGRIWVEAGPDGGSRFVLSLPATS